METPEGGWGLGVSPAQIHRAKAPGSADSSARNLIHVTGTHPHDGFILPLPTPAARGTSMGKVYMGKD